MVFPSVTMEGYAEGERQTRSRFGKPSEAARGLRSRRGPREPQCWLSWEEEEAEGGGRRRRLTCGWELGPRQGSQPGARSETGKFILLLPASILPHRNKSWLPVSPNLLPRPFLWVLLQVCWPQTSHKSEEGKPEWRLACEAPRNICILAARGLAAQGLQRC